MFRHRPLLVVIALFLAPSSCLAAAPATCVAEPEGSRVSLVKEADLAKEASRRVDLLEKQGFFVAQQVAGPIHLEFLIEQSDNLVCLWLATAQGSAKMELRGPNLSPVLLQGPRDEQELMRHLEAGKYVVDVTALNGTQVHGVIGIKGSAVDHLCDADHDRLIERPADPPRYEWPYLLVKPVGLAADGSAPGQEGTLIVVPNNTGFESVNADMLHDSAVCELHFGAGTGPLAIADGLGAPLLIPLFPRPRSVYLQSLCGTA